jgi:hypothetical protein
MARKTEEVATQNGQPNRTKKSDGDGSFTRADFFRDLKKVAKKQDRHSQRDSKKR